MHLSSSVISAIKVWRGISRIEPSISRLTASIGMTVAIALSMTSNVLAQASQAQSTARLSTNERYCEEEKSVAEQWMLWAASKRDECAKTAKDAAEKAACIQQRMQQLDSFENEYAEIYTSQMRNVRPDHPVVKNILRRLRSHKELARNILLHDHIEPANAAEQVKQTCLTASQPPNARPRQR